MSNDAKRFLRNFYILNYPQFEVLQQSNFEPSVKTKSARFLPIGQFEETSQRKVCVATFYTVKPFFSSFFIF